MNSAIEKYMEALSGVTAMTKANAERVAKQLAKQGEVASSQVSEFAAELVEKSKKNRETLTAMINSEIQRAVKGMGLATNEDVARLQKQVADLKRQLQAAKKSTAKKAPAKKTAKKSTAKKSTKKAAAKKTTKKSSS